MKINIFGLEVKVIKRKIRDDLNLYGYFDPKRLEIVLDSDQSQRELAHTYWHEVIHVVFYRIGLRQAISRDLEETICENIATAILSAARIGNEIHKKQNRRKKNK